jgi:hypothetical protein
MTSDIEVLDSAFDWFARSLSAIGEFVTSLVVIASLSRIFLLFTGALMVIVFSGILQFLPISRSLKRLGDTALSQLCTIFGELLQNNGAGLATVFHPHIQVLLRLKV